MNILIYNQKGGVGKTALATEIAGNLAIKGMKVLLMDFDSQSNVAQTFGVNPFDKVDRDTYKVTLDYLSGKDLNLDKFKEIIVSENKKHPNLDILYASPSLTNMEIAFFKNTLNKTSENGIIESYEKIKSLFNKLKEVGGYDAIIIDTSPTLGIFQSSLMYSVDVMIIPAVMEKFSRQGIVGIVESMNSIAELLGQGDNNLERKWKQKLINKINMIIPMKTRPVKDHKEVWQELYETIPKFTNIKVLDWEERVKETTSFAKTIRDQETTPILSKNAKSSSNEATLAITKIIEKHILGN